jgi:hypothetical protein
VRTRGGALALVALCALAAGAAEPPAPARKERIALERLRATGVSAALAETVEERVCAALSEASGAEVICPSDVAAAAALARQAFALGACTTEECLRRVDAVGAADRRVTGALERGEGGLVLSLAIAGAAGPGTRAVERLPEDVDALIARIPDVVRRLLRQGP